MDDITRLDTEQNNVHSWNIDRCSTKEILKIINEEDQIVAAAVSGCLDEIAKLVDQAVMRLAQGGRIFYVGAGTSGRLGILDASECPPTYGVSHELVQGIMAGGPTAMKKAKEGSEDDAKAGQKDLENVHLSACDVVIGLATSGRTPYVIGALHYAKEIGCYTGAISCVHHALISEIADAKMEAVTGPEVICGSTRMKAGTAQKMILNMISTAVMIKLGKVYHNYMVDLQATNEKLYQRAIHMIQMICECTKDKAVQVFEASGHHVKTAILMAESKQSKEACIDALHRSKDHLLLALEYLQKR